MIFFSGAVSAADITVNPGESIQTAIDNANDGDTLNLTEGTYNESNITVNKNITIAGPQIETTESPKAIIDSQNNGRIFYIYSGVTVTLKYLTLTHGNSNQNTANLDGGAIFNDQGNLTVIGCNFYNNSASYLGGGIVNYNGILTITDSSMSLNTADNYGGGIYNNGTLTVTRCNIQSNKAKFLHGGGIYNDHGTVTINDSNIVFNRAHSGGGFYNYLGTMDINNSTMESNYADNGKGAGIWNNGTLSVDNSTIKNNQAVHSAGGIYNEGTCDIINSIISSNVGNYNGGGILNYGGICNITNSTINNNNATEFYGGGIYNNGTLTINGCNITQNKAKILYGGGIYSDHGNLTITYSNITNNMANDGAGLYNNYGNVSVVNSSINNNNAFNRNGGGIYNHGANLTVTDSNINYNHAAASGGGIWNDGTCNIINSIIANNIGYYNGGGILNNGGICNITNSSINNNNATSFSGGGIENSASLIVTNSSINNNKAGQNGGGIRIIGGTGTITGSNIKNNTANIYGGGIYNYGSFTITGCNFESNTATSNGTALYNDGSASNAILHFNRFYDTATGYEIYCNNGTVNATLNWWGSNLNPSSKVFGNVNVNPWLVLNITTTPTTIKNGMNSIITADLTKDSNGLYYSPASGHIPDGIPVGFITTLGTIYNPELSTIDGIAQATLNGGSISGDATVTAAVDYQSLQTTISIDNIIPTAYANSKGGLYNYDKNIRLYITNNEPGTIYYTLNGSTPTTSSTKYTGGPILISSTTTLRFIAVDLAGNLSPVYTEKYTIDKVRPTITSVSIKNQAIEVSRTNTIVIKFSENIKTSINWNKFYIKNLSTGKTVSISKWISGNTLYLKTTNTKAAYTWYQVYIPGYSVKDNAGNNLAVGYWFKFRTGKY